MQGSVAPSILPPPASTRPPAGGAVTSRITAQAFELSKFQESGVLEAGLVNLIALDAVVERLGERWQGRREAVYDMVERVLSRRLGEGGAFARGSETDFLVIQP